jgi:hypothetical protein
LSLSGCHPEAVKRKAKTRKLRAFGNSIVLLVFSPLFAVAAAGSLDFSIGGVLLGLVVGVLAFLPAVFALRWSLRKEAKTPGP